MMTPTMRFLLLALVFISHDLGYAQTILFGPTQYTRTAGPPNSFTGTFPLPSGTTAPYTLHIVNGNADGTKRVSSATVKVNGTQILGPNDFGQNVAVLDRTVTLQSSNQLEIRLTSAPGSVLTVSVLDTNPGTQPTALTPSPLNVTVGATGTLTAALSPAPSAAGSLAASSADPAVATVPASVSFAAGQTSVPVPVTGVASGSTTITVLLNGGSAASQVTVSPPSPTITSFTPASGTVGDTVTITGTHFINVQAVTVNGTAAIFTVTSATSLTAVVPLGATTGKIAVVNAAGTGTSATHFTVIALSSLAVTPTQATLPIGSQQPFHSTATFADQSTLDVTSLTTWTSAAPSTASVTTAGVAQGIALGTTTITGTLGAFNGSSQVQVIAASATPLPPDPSTVAPPLDQTVPTAMGTATAFLYTGANPIQTGVVAGTITAQRAAVIRGQVKDRTGFPIPGVTVTILNHPEFGQTLTRPDGLFDLAVNGGGRLTVSYTKSGLFPVQRHVEVAWGTFSVASDVVMIPFDTQVTTVTANAAALQVAQGSAVTDAAGTRRATLFVPAGTTATMTLPGGGTQPLSTLHIRLTEYTVGPQFKQTLPASLPPGDLNQYALELTVDEAVSAGATRVSFSQPVLLYVDNFLNFECGDPLPTGSYDPQRAVWVPEPSGAVVQILSVTAGLADVDTDGNGTADNTGLTTAERQQLAAQYPVGTKLWRIPTTHFSTTKSACNTTTPPGATGPNGGEPTQKDPKVNDPDCQRGSVIGCQNQTLAESLAVTGTPFRVAYTSDRTRGRLAANQIQVPLSGSTVPAPLKRIDLTVTQGGRSTITSYPPLAGQQVTLLGDGRDPYGRSGQGPRATQIHLDFVYDGVHKVTGLPRGREVALSQDWVVRHGGWDQQALGLGGWSLSVHHVYDPTTTQLHRGDGTSVQAEALSPIVQTLAGGGTPADGLGDGGPAMQASLVAPHYLAVGPDGSLYIADQLHHRVRKVDPQGIITTVAGTGTAGFSGDGGPATAAQLNRPIGIALGPDGSLYISEIDNVRIRRVNPQGIITTFAGTGTAGFSGDGGPATAAQLSSQLRGLAIGPDGTVYLADTFNHRIRRVKTNGLIETLAGTGTVGFSGDNGPATQARFNSPWGVAVGPDGAVYVADTFNYVIRRIDTEGIITTVAGTPLVSGITGDGGLATEARVLEAVGVAVRADGALFIGGYNHHRIRWVDPATKFITSLAGTGQGLLDAGFGGDGGPAAAAQMAWPSDWASCRTARWP